MGKFIYDSLETIFNGSLMEDLNAYISKLFASASSILSGDILTVFYNIFIGIACAMLILFFYMDLVSQASKELFSFEKLVVAFIKIMAGFCLLLCIKDIVIGITEIGQNFFKAMSDDSLTQATSQSATEGLVYCFGGEEYAIFPSWEEVKDAFEDKYNGISNIGDSIGLVLVLIVPALIMLLAKGAGYFICSSVIIIFLIRCILAPIAVVQCFEEGSRSSGIRYLKKLASTSITLGVIVIITRVSGLITGQIFVNMIKDLNISTVSFEEMGQIINFKNIIFLIMPNIVLIGSIIGAQIISDDVLGAK